MKKSTAYLPPNKVITFTSNHILKASNVEIVPEEEENIYHHYSVYKDKITYSYEYDDKGFPNKVVKITESRIKIDDKNYPEEDKDETTTKTQVFLPYFSKIVK